MKWPLGAYTSLFMWLLQTLDLLLSMVWVFHKTLEIAIPTSSTNPCSCYITFIGCKQDILYILATLFATWKHQKNSFWNFEPSFNILKQMKLLFFSWASLASFWFFKAICVISFGLEKVPQKYPQQFFHSLGVGDDFNYENKLH